MKIEVKSKENQRLSMHNEQLQFRLQSNNSTISNINDSLFNSPNVSLVAESPSEHSSAHAPLRTDEGHFEIRTRNQKTKLTRAATLSSQSYELDIKPEEAKKETVVTTSIDACRLRSKSLKAQVDLSGKKPGSSARNQNEKLFSSFHQPGSTSSSSSFNQQFRPVSEHFDFNIDDREIYMTRSVNIYERSSSVNQDENSEAAFLSQFEEYDSMIESSTTNPCLERNLTESVTKLNEKEQTQNESGTTDANDETKMMEEENGSVSSNSSISMSNANVNNQSVVFVE
jgi:hypothetical protein